METPEIFICGCIRSPNKRDLRNIKRLMDLSNKASKLIHTIIVESDSSVQSKPIIESLSRLPKTTVIRLGSLEPKIPNRIARIAHCRNYYHNEIKALISKKGFPSNPVAIVADFDLNFDLLNVASLRSSLNLIANNSFSILGANSLPYYYDILALRHPIWNSCNPWNATKSLSNNIGHRDAKRICIRSKQISLDARHPPIPVESCFGGLIITNASNIAKYNFPDSAEYSECEHVEFVQATAKTCELSAAIDPQLVIGPNLDHVRGKSYLQCINVIGKYVLNQLRH